jgi:hypothetical protein
MIMRELIKKSGHIGDKVYLQQNETLFKGHYRPFTHPHFNEP